MGRASRNKPTRLAEKLTNIRLAFGLSQTQMLKKLGDSEKLTRASISGYELGEREPSSLMLLKYAGIAGVYVDVLIDDSLDLPEKLPCSPKHPGIPRQKAPAKSKVRN